MSKNLRNYRTKDVDMLVAASTILESAIANKALLQQKRTSWKDPFFDDLKAKIDTAVQVYLGIDNAKQLRQVTLVMNELKKGALKSLSEFKVQAMEDFKGDEPRRDELIKQLGFTANLTKAQRGDQEALISLLYQFKLNIAVIQAEVISKGTSPELINTIIDYADKVKATDVSQEYSKGTRKVITAEAIQEFNDIHSSIISIAKIAAVFFKDAGPLKDQFSFNKVAKTMNAQRFTPSEPGETATS